MYVCDNLNYLYQMIDNFIIAYKRRVKIICDIVYNSYICIFSM